MGISQQLAASRSIQLLRQLRAVEPLSSCVSEAQLAEALSSLARHLPGYQAGAPPSAAFLHRTPLRSLWLRSG